MKSFTLLGLVATLLAVGPVAAESATDPLTKLPLPAAGAPWLLYMDANKLDDVPVCKSKGTMNFYSAKSGTVKTAIAWYVNNLPGFRHIHGMGSGRSQDSFYNAAGTLVVSVTGEPGAEGQDTKVYSVIYATIAPGLTDKVIAGMNVQKIVCP